MGKFRFSVVLLCVLLPPVFYILGVQGIERYAENRILTGLRRTFLGDTQLLFNGSLTLKEAVRANVDHFLARSRWLKWGGKAVVTVQTRHNTLIYPLIETDLHSPLDPGESPFEIASENYRLINEGLNLSMVFKLPHNTLITNAVIGGLMLLSVLSLYVYYRHWSRHLRKENASREAEIDRLSKLQTEYQCQLAALESDRFTMAQEIERMKADFASEKEKAESSEEEMLEDIIALEEKIAEKEALQARQGEEILELQAKLLRLENNPKEFSRKRKPLETARKRFNTLYKNLDLHDKAVEGYLALTEELKLKCEEVIIQLNENPSAVQVKRKVFGKKNRITVLEVVFGYRGRLYFIPKGDSRAELITIGTKNSQPQDLAYLERL
jgi:hypothetical protein